MTEADRLLERWTDRVAQRTFLASRIHASDESDRKELERQAAKLDRVIDAIDRRMKRLEESDGRRSA